MPLDALPLRNVPVVRPPLPSPRRPCRPTPSPTRCFSLRRLDLHASEGPVALCYGWAGSATFARLDAFCRGVTAGMAEILSRPPSRAGRRRRRRRPRRDPLPRGGQATNPVISIDGVTLKDFDFIDIGAFLEVSGAVPVVIVAGVSNVGGSGPPKATWRLDRQSGNVARIVTSCPTQSAAIPMRRSSRTPRAFSMSRMATRSLGSSAAIRAAGPRWFCTAAQAGAARPIIGGCSIRRATACSCSISAGAADRDHTRRSTPTPLGTSSRTSSDCAT